MPQNVARAMLLTGIVLCVGCSSRFQRSKYDPFATARQGSSKSDHAPADYPQLVPAGSGGEEVTQAGREYYAKRATSDRSQRDQVGSDETRENVQDPTWDSFRADTPARSPSRPSAGKPLDHAPDYSWIQGKLDYTNLGGGMWRVRYAALSADDEHGGCVILQSVPNAQRFQPGDIVYVEGQILESNSRGPLPNPLYRVDLMNRVGD